MNEFHLLLATSRPAIATFFLSLRHRSAVSPRISQIPLVAEVSVGGLPDLRTLAVAVLDVASDPLLAVRLCRDLHARQARLPLLALLCCPYAVTPSQLLGLVDAGVMSFMDLEATEDEVLRVLARAARGDVVLQVRVSRNQSGVPWLGGILGAPQRGRGLPPGHPRTAATTRLLTLVARGWSDSEIGHHLHLSPHTVKHQLDQLREEIGVRNRLELAAWAGRQGFYRPDLVVEEPADQVTHMLHRPPEPPGA